MPGENIAQHLTECAEFIDRALSMRCGMVFIASYMGKRNMSKMFVSDSVSSIMMEVPYM